MFAYEPIDLDRPAFRLLNLRRGKWSDIECTMYQAYLDGDDTIPYDALSYTWGGTHKTSTVIVNGEALRVTENLHSALQHLRSENVDKTLWVDAICIDQGNERERGHQVQQMCKIYSQAEEVIVWLGQATRETNTLFESLQRLQEHSFLYGHGHRHWDLAKWKELWLSVPKDSDCELRDGLFLLLSRPWFKRVWILQEIANAKKASILCGTKSIRAHTFALAPSLIGVKPQRHCRAVLDIMPGHLREETWWSENRDLYNLLLKFRESEASDPRDQVYALLGISSDAQDTGRLRPDYTKDLENVIYDTSSFLFGPSDSSYWPSESPYGRMAGFLSNLTSRSVASFTKLAEMHDVSEVDLFLKRRGLEVPLSEDMIKAAAGNEVYGKAVVSLLLLERRNEFRVTADVIKAAVKNKTSGRDIINLLLQEEKDRFRATICTELIRGYRDSMGREEGVLMDIEYTISLWRRPGFGDDEEEESRIFRNIQGTSPSERIVDYGDAERRDGETRKERIRGNIRDSLSLARRVYDILEMASPERMFLAAEMLLQAPGANVDEEGANAALAKRREAVLRLLQEPSASSVTNRSSIPVSPWD
ncbi:heterokaryon incompatibility protein-domain-containing protein [Alternaria alternata]|jgi:hypothetical protein|nr:heterokaryon incompatibility protein-domain-containing protein [Alternaria alternata]